VLRDFSERMVRELVQRFWETSRRDRGGAAEGFASALGRRSPGGASEEMSMRRLKPLVAVVAAVAKGPPEGSLEALPKAPSRSLR
jgi:hypothetical protein